MLPRMNIGFIGPGSQGYGMAEMIRRSGYPLHLWARRAATLEPFEGTDAIVVGSKRELGERCDLVGVCVMSDADVEEVVVGEEGLLAGMKPESIIAIHSTVAPDTCIRIGGIASERGVHVVDAPVSGSSEGALKHSLTVFGGGDPDVFERARPVFETYGDPVRLLGPLGSGQVFKLLNNLLFTANLSMGIDALGYAEQMGLDGAAVEELLLASSGRSEALHGWCARVTPGDMTRVHTILHKDVGLAASVAKANGVGVGGLVEAADRVLADMADGTYAVPPGRSQSA
jgi:3-hydroxyisobutyrate dehydrogenase-like beta-hydroxyacid dehydrogenase